MLPARRQRRPELLTSLSAGKRAVGNGDRGTMVVEFVLLVPLLLLLLLFLVMAGRIVEAHGEVDGAARDAARAATISRSPQAAPAAADSAVAADINGWCPNPTVTGFAPASPAVTVRLTCGLQLGFINLGTVRINGFAVAPLDPFVARQF